MLNSSCFLQNLCFEDRGENGRFQLLLMNNNICCWRICFISVSLHPLFLTLNHFRVYGNYLSHTSACFLAKFCLNSFYSAFKCTLFFLLKSFSPGIAKQIKNNNNNRKKKKKKKAIKLLNTKKDKRLSKRHFLSPIPHSCFSFYSSYSYSQVISNIVSFPFFNRFIF